MKNPEKPTCQPAREIETDAGPMALTVIEGGALRSEEIEVAESLPEGMVDIYDELLIINFPSLKISMILCLIHGRNIFISKCTIKNHRRFRFMLRPLNTPPRDSTTRTLLRFFKAP